MVEYLPRQSHNWKLPEPDPEPAEEQAGQQPIAVDLVYNSFAEPKGKTIAITVSLKLPQLQS